MYKQHATEVTS